MNSRDLTLVSSATLIGAVASAIIIRCFFTNPKQQSSHKTSNSSGFLQQNRVFRDPFDPSKRKEYISWDDYFMAIAFLSAQRSKDPNRQVGACLVSQNGVILGIGYNGFPRGCSDDKLPWSKKSRNGDALETKYPYYEFMMNHLESLEKMWRLFTMDWEMYVCHAEVNAILNTNHASAAGQKLYVTMFPCNECAKIIIQSGVSEVIYFVEKRLENSDKSYVASHKLLAMAGVKVRKHQPQMDQVTIKFEES